MRRRLVMLILLAGCRTGAPKATFPRLVDEYIEAGNRFAPTGAVASGFHAYDAELEVWSRERIDARIAELHRFADRLAALDRRALSFDDAVDAEALEHDARASLLELEKVRSWERNPMGYASLAGEALNVLMKRDFAPARERLRSAITRLRAVPAIYAAARANLTTPPKELTEAAIEDGRGAVAFLESSFPIWAREAAGGDTALLAEATAANSAALAAARDFVSWLEKDLAPRSTGSFALGEALFREKLSLEDMVDLPLAELLARGEAQLARDRAAFVAVTRQIDATRSPDEVFERVMADHPTAAGLIDAVAGSVEATRAFVVEKDLLTIPSEVRPRVTETPAYDRAGGLASMDTPGPFESKATEAFYYVTPVEKDWDAKRTDEYLRAFAGPIMALTNIHEAFPGHFVQFLYVPRLASKTRKVVFASSNTEGWAHYTEEMLVDAGFGGGDPRIRLAQLEEALLRDCRYVVGIKLHTQGMTVAEGAKLFHEQCAQTPPVAYVEARRGTFNPTYLYYTLGKLMIREMRDEYMKTKGATAKQFHDAFLGLGGLPLPLVRRLLFR